MKLTLANGDSLPLSRPIVMGILNVTPDSFSDGGQFTHVDVALAHALNMQAEGAAIIDIGGESTRPGAQPVNADDELRRVIPVIEAIRRKSDVLISIDTCKPAVMRAAVLAGADIINDVNALRAESAVETVAELGVPVCLMHMQGEPRTMQHQPRYANVVEEVKQFLLERAQCCEQAGITPDKIILDQGFGFGKSLAHNLELFQRMTEFVELPYPLLVGVSRKSMVGALLDGAAPAERVYGSVALATLACSMGAKILRVHDVRATVDAIKMYNAIQ